MSKKQEEILSAAREVFTKYGYKKTTLEDIGRAVGLNQASLYYYYKNKETIFLSIIITDVEDFKKAIQRMLPEEPVIILRVKKYFLEKFHFIQQNPFLSQIIDLNFKQITPEIGKQIMQLQEFEFEGIQTILSKGVENGEFPSMDCSTIAKIIIKIAEGIRIGPINQFIINKGEIDYDLVIEELNQALDIIFRGLSIEPK